METNSQSLLSKATNLLQEGKLDEAKTLCHSLLKNDQDNPQLNHLLGVVYKEEGHYPQAIDFFNRAIAGSNNIPIYYYNLGSAYALSDHHEEALACFQHTLKLDPANVGAQFNAAVSLHKLNRTQEAIDSIKLLVKNKPADTKLLYLLGELYRDSQQFQKAVNTFLALVEVDPNHIDALVEISNICNKDEQYDTAIAYLNKANKLQSNNGKILTNLGSNYAFIGEYDKALTCFKQAACINPEEIFPLYNLSHIYFTTGKWQEGLKYHEYRWGLNKDPFIKPPYPQPWWQGQDLSTKTILIWGEQGIGDTIMFANMLSEIAEKAQDVIYITTPKLLPLLKRSFPNISIIASDVYDEQHPAYHKADYQLPIGSLLPHFRQTIDHFPTHEGYLKIDQEKADYFTKKYQELFPGKRTIGLSWRTLAQKTPASRSLTLEQLTPFFAHPECQFINLQYGNNAKTIKQFEHDTSFHFYTDEEVDTLDDIDSLAAQITALDLVISIDNATVHLAGALGKATWTMLPFVPDWRWLLERSDTIWYPSMQLFRQSEIGNWDSVIKAISQQL